MYVDCFYGTEEKGNTVGSREYIFICIQHKTTFMLSNCFLFALVRCHRSLLTEHSKAHGLMEIRVSHICQEGNQVVE